ncbi:MAG: hypothetical protein KDK38_10575 [Leptospiraceae bacterium]|nr:hypothetical protein [Leptospiraceae bacterium]
MNVSPMLKTLKYIFLSISLLLIFTTSCREHDHNSHHSMGEKTKITKSEGYRLIFDLQNMQEHQSMMKQMNLQMTHADDISHIILLTPVNESNMSVLKEADVVFSIQSSQNEVRQVPAKVMQGGGMYHYYLELKAQDDSALKVQATLKKGQTELGGKVEFTLHP